jgi:predicted DNA-binding antitoxin AbrB/MazE fold protein
MPEHHQTSVSGTVTAVFAHRFVIESKGAKHLADIGPEALKHVDLKEGDKVTVTGERKPSEIKVTEIVTAGGKPVRIEHKKKKHDHDAPHAYRDPHDAIEAVKQQGFKVIAEPRRKPKHFEILGRSAKGEVVEFHVELDGDIRKRKPAALDEPKWKSTSIAK